jgi:hypothetical protein
MSNLYTFYFIDIYKIIDLYLIDLLKLICPPTLVTTKVLKKKKLIVI